MKFEDLDIKQEYDSRRNFVYGDFFNKILPNSNLYCRFGGVFSGRVTSPVPRRGGGVGVCRDNVSRGPRAND